jgi:hypothetical protein
MRFYHGFKDRLNRNEIPGNSKEAQNNKVKDYMSAIENPNPRPELKATVSRLSTDKK